MSGSAEIRINGIRSERKESEISEKESITREIIKNNGIYFLWFKWEYSKIDYWCTWFWWWRFRRYIW